MNIRNKTSPGLVFVQRAFMVGLFLGELIGEVYFWRNIAFQNGLGLTIKLAAQNTKTTA